MIMSIRSIKGIKKCVIIPRRTESLIEHGAETKTDHCRNIKNTKTTIRLDY